jgi:regulatory protein
VADEELAEVIGRLIEAGALDDRRFARRYAEDKRELADWGPERILEALQARGVAAEEIDAALAAEPESAQIERAAGLLERRGAAVGDEAERGRALALLARRGFPLEVAYDAVRARERKLVSG